MSISLYRKYRPQNFSQVIGQEHIVRTLSNSIANDRIGHAYLLTGPRGTGKTTFARIFARAVNCLEPKKSEKISADACLSCTNCKHIDEGKSFDIFEIDAASNTGVENIRELRETVKLPPTLLKYKVYIIDEVHMLSTGAFNALLKTLEEPPSHVIFILATTEIHKVPETIISRCQRFDFSRISIEHIIEKLSRIAKEEKITIEKEALEMIAIAAEGGMRDAESLFSQVITLEDKNITANEVEEILGTTKRKFLEEMSSFLIAKDPSSAISLLNKLVTDGYDLAVFHKSLLNYLRQLLIISVDQSLEKIFSRELTSEQLDFLKNQVQKSKPQEILRIISCFSDLGNKIRSAFIPQLPLEMAIVDATSGIENSKSEITTQPKITPAPQKPQIETQKTNTTTVPQNPPIAAESLKIAPENPAIETKVEPQTQEAQPKETPIQDEQGEAETIGQPNSTEQGPIKNSEFSLNDVRLKWNAVFAEIKATNMSLATLFPHCKPVSVEANILTLGTRFSFYKDKIDDTKNKLTLEDIFAKIIGSPVKLRAIIDEGAKNAPESITSIPSRDNSVPSETSSLLADAMGMMGGQMVE
jgi:DNA polymerase-3 subunit gamma/tau